MNVIFPTSSDIYIEADGRKLAAVQSYKAVAEKSEKRIGAFGSAEPVAVLTTGLYYRLELTRLYATDEAISDGIDFHGLDDFSVVIVKPDRRIVYTGCRWSGIEETGKLGQTIAEKVRVIAAKRLELKP